MDWKVAHLRVHARARAGIETPFAGSILRGAFGAALLRRSSGEGARDGCPEEAASLHRRLFDPPPCPPGSRAREDRGEGPETPPRRGGCARPFVLDPPAGIREGPLSFDLKLFGFEPEALSEVLAALIEMGESGIGRERVPLPVEAIESLTPGAEAEPVGGRTIGAFPGRIRRWSASLLLDGQGGRDTSAPAALREISILFRTPFRRKEGGRIASTLPLEGIVRAALRRLTDLGEALGQCWPRSWPSVLAAARSSTSWREETRWLDWGRYSLRQGRAMRLGGVVGRADYRAVPGPLIPLLRAALFAHLGKNASFGLGVADLVETDLLEGK